MHYKFLEGLFNPRSIAVIGASAKPQRVGHAVMRNLLAGGFAGPVMPVNPLHESVSGVLTYPDVASLPHTPDLAIICTRADTVTGLVDRLGQRGTRTAIVMAGDLDRAQGPDGRSVEATMLEAARRHGMRLLGGSTLGVMVPRFGFNATFAQVSVRPGPIAFVSQSDAVGAMVLDWAKTKKVGFSHFVSLGAGADIDFGDVLEYLANDWTTRAVLLYIESLRNPHLFMAAARSVASKKPVLAIKAGRSPQNPLLGISDPLILDTPALIDGDDVYDAVLRRAGILRVAHIDELFGAVETLARLKPMGGERLVVVSNGGGAGVMAEDMLHAGGYALPPLSERLRSRWNGRNPIDIRFDATPQVYAGVFKALIEANEADAIMVIHTPVPMTSSADIAQAIIDTSKSFGGSLFTSWIGDESVAPERRRFVETGIASFDTPSGAAQAFLHLLNQRRNRETLMQTPPSIPDAFEPDVEAVCSLIREALAAGRGRLDEPQAKAAFAAYGIPIEQTYLATTAAEAASIARRIGLPVALTIISPDIRSKWDVGGIALNLESAESVEAAAHGMIERIGRLKPEASVGGFSVQRMVPRGHARQLLIGVATDPLFGPVILFGDGGRAVQLYRDLAIGLPPLNLALAKDLIGRTRAAALLGAHHHYPAADIDAVALTLTQVSQLVVDHPEIVALDINPLFADHRGVIAVDGHIRLTTSVDPDRLVIKPYPKTLEENFVLRDGRTVLLRPIRPEDEPAHFALMEKLSAEDIRLRCFRYINNMTHAEMARLTQIDYDREMAFIATLTNADGQPETLGVVRTTTDPDNQAAEFAIVIRSDLKGQGLGSRMLRKMIDYCKQRGTRNFVADVLAENTNMLKLAAAFKFSLEHTDEAGVVRISLPL